ncbi:MAG TPA: chemotaxis protein CheW, partial [Firmicutes bacterium]|nr:chemotaxis protein CheW [Bacillota bacterium]
MKKKSDKKELKQFLIFTVAGKKFAIELDYITEIGEYMEIMIVPRAKKYILGVINLRGIIVPVISLRKRFKLSEDKITKDTGLIYIKKDDVIYGIM